MTTLNQKNKTKNYNPVMPEATTLALKEEQVVRELQALNASPSSQAVGEFDSRDIAIPYLTIVQKIKNAEEAPKLGKYVYDKEIIVGDNTNVIFLRMQKFYMQKMNDDSQDLVPLKFDSRSAAEASGLEFMDAANLDLFIEVKPGTPAYDYAYFTHKGLGYCLARYSVKATSYNATVKILYRDFKSCLGGDLASRVYTLGVEKKNFKKFEWYQPSLRLGAATPQEVRTLIKEKMKV